MQPPLSPAPTLASSTTSMPTPNPTLAPTYHPSLAPTLNPTTFPTPDRTAGPYPMPTNSGPTRVPTSNPSFDPTQGPTPYSTRNPTLDPTFLPVTSAPTAYPTPAPTYNPSQTPTQEITPLPTPSPTHAPTFNPTQEATPYPTPNPTVVPNLPATFEATAQPTRTPTYYPSQLPTQGKTPLTTPLLTQATTPNPPLDPTHEPTLYPISNPTEVPTNLPATYEPRAEPTSAPTEYPWQVPTKGRTPLPTPSPLIIAVDAAPTMEPTPSPASLALSSKPAPFPTQPLADPTYFGNASTGQMPSSFSPSSIVSVPSHWYGIFSNPSLPSLVQLPVESILPMTPTSMKPTQDPIPLSHPPSATNRPIFQSPSPAKIPIKMPLKSVGQSSNPHSPIVVANLTSLPTNGSAISRPSVITPVPTHFVGNIFSHPGMPSMVKNPVTTISPMIQPSMMHNSGPTLFPTTNRPISFSPPKMPVMAIATSSPNHFSKYPHMTSQTPSFEKTPSNAEATLVPATNGLLPLSPSPKVNWTRIPTEGASATSSPALLHEGLPPAFGSSGSPSGYNSGNGQNCQWAWSLLAIFVSIFGGQL